MKYLILAAAAACLAFWRLSLREAPLPSSMSPLPCLSFVAPSGVGKTTLLESVVACLVARGLRPAVLKASHEDHRLDVEGKDSWRFSAAGASLVGLVGPGVSTLFLDGGHRSWPGAPAVVRWIAACPFLAFDLVLCEGFSFDPALPKLRVVRGPWPGSEPAWSDLVAVAWDGTGRPAGIPAGVPLLPLEGPAVADWIACWARAGEGGA